MLRRARRTAAAAADCRRIRAGCALRPARRRRCRREGAHARRHPPATSPRGCSTGAARSAPARSRRSGRRRRRTCTALQIGAAADELALVAARLFEQHRQDAADAASLKRAAAAPAAPASAPAARPSPARAPASAAAAGVPGPRRIFEREGLGKADLAHQVERGLEIRVALAGKADDEIGRQRDVGPGCAEALDGGDNRRRCAAGSSPPARGRSRTAPADAETASARRRRDGRRSAVVDIARMAGGVADAREPGDLGQRAHQIAEAPFPPSGAAP